MENSMSSGERELPERWSAKRKAEIVLRLLRGEDLGEISREIQVAPQVIEEWRRSRRSWGKRSYGRKRCAQNGHAGTYRNLLPPERSLRRAILWCMCEVLSNVVDW